MNRRQLLKKAFYFALGSSAAIYLTKDIERSPQVELKNNFLVIHHKEESPPYSAVSGDGWVEYNPTFGLPRANGAVYARGKKLLFIDKIYLGINAYSRYAYYHPKRGFPLTFEYRPKYNEKIGFDIFSDKPLEPEYRRLFKQMYLAMKDYRGTFYRLYVYLHEIDIDTFRFYPDLLRIDVTYGRNYSIYGMWHELSHAFYHLLKTEHKALLWTKLSQNKYIEAIDESNSLSLPEYIGHPKDNASELFASALTTLKFSKDKTSLKIAENIISSVLNKKQIELLLNSS